METPEEEPRVPVFITVLPGFMVRVEKGCVWLPVVPVAVMVIVLLPVSVRVTLAPKYGPVDTPLAVLLTRANPKVLLLSTTPAPAVEDGFVVRVLDQFTVSVPPPMIVRTLVPMFQAFTPFKATVRPLAMFQVWLPPSANGAPTVKFTVAAELSIPTPLTPLRVKRFAAVASVMATLPVGLAIMISPMVSGPPTATVLAAVTVLSHLPMSAEPGTGPAPPFHEPVALIAVVLFALIWVAAGAASAPDNRSRQMN